MCFPTRRSCSITLEVPLVLERIRDGLTARRGPNPVRSRQEARQHERRTVPLWCRTFSSIPISAGGMHTRDEIFRDWKAAIAELSRCPNVVAKIGGIQMVVNG